MNIDHIHTLTIVGGLLDGTRIAFDPGLNCIIGARGTGKTTLLEFVRWVLDELPRKDIAPAARKRIESLIEGNLQGGRVAISSPGPLGKIPSCWMPPATRPRLR
jgi:predicted ATPase